MELFDLLLAKQLGGGGGGGSATINPLSVSANGTYTATGGVDGYSPVTVNVPQPSGTKNIISNGDYDVATYASAHVSVPTGITPTGTLSITSNGTYNVTNYASADVNVSGGGSDSRFKEVVERTITEVNDSTLTTIGSFAFIQCTALTKINAPNVTSIFSSAFQSCSNLTSVDMPALTTIRDNAFYSCSKLATLNISAVTTVGMYAFRGCSSLTSVNLPNITTFTGSSAFQGCSRLSSINVPNLTNTGEGTFTSCAFSSIDFPIVTTIGSSAFYGCSSLATASFPKASSINREAFRGCTHLLSLYLLGSSIPTLGNISNVFSSTPIGGYTASTGGVYGSVFVPASLYNSYLSKQIWSDYSARIVSV